MVISSVPDIESSAATPCLPDVQLYTRHPAERLDQQGWLLHIFKRRYIGTSVHLSFTCRPLWLCNLHERVSATANVPVQLRTRIVGLVAIQIRGQ